MDDLSPCEAAKWIKLITCSSFINSTSGISAEKPSAGLVSGSHWNPLYRKDMNQDNQRMSCQPGTNISGPGVGAADMLYQLPGTVSKGDSCCSRACPHLCQPEKLLFKNLSLTTESKEPDCYIRSDHLAQWSSPVTVNNNHLKSFKKYQPSVKRDQQIRKD